ncbi:hypothetical protein FA95DRAFT_1683761 [Auriscalpium vulgare]|uniref:Uncharacterized protein n=1 Tax=Auriscalpium vulgare TaxID=40419 RepID=A0ACB8R8Z5_9AGAM|nr:hypothetical protein FA95DRAFT_1683761 [Auriscalpium vulgare]
MRVPALALAAAVALGAHARPGHLPDDPFAFPKHRVSFLNGLPLLNETAQRWLREGLAGGEPEFLDQPWESRWDPHVPRKEIGSGDDRAPATPQAPSSLSVEHMKMGPRDSYLCLIPPELDPQPVPAADEPHAEVTAVHSWSLLQPLAGGCIYHRQGWFTYAYCHNSHVRQFRELFHPPTAGGYQIEEDPDWEAYDLGRAPAPDTGAALTVTEQAAQLANLELARGAGSRYLVQRWGDGTVCDKTGRRREIEVQFHCSMTMTDSIMFVKETKTCHYVLVVNTPRLCSEPGFKSRLDHRADTPIRCRRVVDAETLATADSALPEADFPLRRTKAPGAAPPAPLDAAAGAHTPSAPDTARAAAPAEADTHEADEADDALQRTLAALLGKAGLPASGPGAPRVVVEDVGDGEMVIEFYSEIEADEQELELELGDDAEADIPKRAMLEKALRAAGYDVRGSAAQPGDKKRGQGKEGKKDARKTPPAVHQRWPAPDGRDEL